MAMEMVGQFLYSKAYLVGKEWKCNLKGEDLHLIVGAQMVELSCDQAFVNFLYKS